MNNTLLWYYRLGHISETRINKLYKEEFFDPYDYELLGTCESCLMEKMIKTPFSGHGERMSYLDLYRPMYVVLRQQKLEEDTLIL